MAERKVSFIEVNGDVTAAQLKLLTTLFAAVITKSDGRVFVGGDVVSPLEIQRILKGSDDARV
jgi:hypothetical protein